MNLENINNHHLSATQTCKEFNVEAQNAMMQAVQSNDADMFAIALRNGADPFLHGDKRFLEALTPFHNAAMKGYTAIVDTVLKARPKLVDRREPKFQKTALHFAATHGHAKLVRLLTQKYGANPIPMAADLWTPLHYSAENGHEECIRVLLDHGADPNAQNDRLQTPLHLAAVFNNGKALGMLVSHYGSRVLFVKKETTKAITESCPLIPDVADIVSDFAITACNFDIKDEWNKTAYDWANECMDWKQEADPRAVDMFYLAWDDYEEQQAC